MLNAATPLPIAANVCVTNPANEAARGLAPPILLQYWPIVLCWKWMIAGVTVAALTFGLIATDPQGLQILPVGPMLPDASDPLSSDRMFLLKQQLRDRFEYIVIDAPPMLDLTDPTRQTRPLRATSLLWK